MSFDIIKPNRPFPNTPTEPYVTRFAMYRTKKDNNLCFNIMIGPGVMAQLGWLHGDRVRLLWGQDKDLHKIRVERPQDQVYTPHLHKLRSLSSSKNPKPTAVAIFSTQAYPEWVRAYGACGATTAPHTILRPAMVLEMHLPQPSAFQGRPVRQNPFDSTSPPPVFER